MTTKRRTAFAKAAPCWPKRVRAGRLRRGGSDAERNFTVTIRIAERRSSFANLHQPGSFNKTVDAGFVNKVEEVKRLLAEADGYYQSGQYDKAMKRYDRVLALDPYNTAARRGQERIDNTKYQYGEEA